MKKIIGLLCVGVATSAFAMEGNYIEVDAGEVTAHSSALFTLDGPGGRLAAGHWWGDGPLHYGLESGVLVYPHLNNGADTYNGYNVELLGVGSCTFKNHWLIFAKLGVAYVHQQTHWEMHLQSFDTTLSADETYHAFQPEGVLGVGYQWSPHWRMTVSEIIVPGNAETSGVSAFMVGMAYTF